MDIETLVKKHAGHHYDAEADIRAALTEQAAEYEQKLAEDKRTHLRELQEASDLGTNQLASTAMQLQVAQERIRQLEAEQVPEGWKMVPIVPTDAMTRAMVDGFIAVNGDNNSEFLRGYSRMLAAAPTQEKDNRPTNCRNRLSDEGKPYPRSGCAHCKTGGITGCPFKKENSNG